MAPEDYDFEGGGGVPDFLRDPLGIPKRHWRWMLLAFVLATAATSFAVSRWEPSYLASSSILVASQQIPKEFIRTTVPEDPFSRLNAMVSQVLSRQKLVGLIEEFDLFPNMREHVPLEEVVASMRAKIVIQGQGGRRAANEAVTARVYTISYEGATPKLAADVANRLAALFLEAGIQSRMDRAGEISRFLRQEMQRSDEILRQQNREIAEFNERYRGELPSDMHANLQKLDRLNQQKQSLELQIMDTEARLSTMPAGLDPNAPEARLAALRQRHDAEIAIRTPEHPTVKALQRQIDALEAQIASSANDPESAQTRSSLALAGQHQIANFRAQLARVESDILELDARVARTPKHSEELAALTEKAGVSREKYLEFLRKVNAAELAQTLENAQQGAQVSIMDRAFPPRSPVRSRSRVILIGVLGTIVATLGAGLALEVLDPVLVAQDQIEKITGLPELGSVAHIS